MPVSFNQDGDEIFTLNGLGDVVQTGVETYQERERRKGAEAEARAAEARAAEAQAKANAAKWSLSSLWAKPAVKVGLIAVGAVLALALLWKLFFGRRKAAS